MARPKLSEDSFLKHLFTPKKNPLPTGIRKRPIAFTPGRTKGRVASYNRMTGASQEMLRRAGLRDAYLKGEATLSDARKALRDAAVRLGMVKPTRAQLQEAMRRRPTSSLDGDVAMHVSKTLAKSGRIPKKEFYTRIKMLPDHLKREILTWDLARIRAYASHQPDDDDADEYMVYIDGKPFNPLWYNS